MKTTNIFSLFLLSSIFISSCRKGGTCEDGFFGLDRAEQTQQIQVAQQVGEAYQEGSCTVKTMKWAPGVEDFILLDQFQTMYPGLILGASTLSDGSFATITGDRAPLTLSTTLQGVEYTNIEAASGNRSDVTQAITDLISQEITGQQPADSHKEIETVYSSEQLMAAVGGKVGGPWGAVSAGFNWNSNTEKSRTLVKYTQVYYSVIVDEPEEPQDFWNKCPDAFVFNGDVPVYVSAVKYGRMALFMIESDLSADSLNIYLNATFNGAVNSGEITAEHQANRILQTSKVEVIVKGGPADAAAEIQTLEDFNFYVSQGANYSSESRAQPIAYTLKYVDDNSTAKVITATEYQVRECAYGSGNNIALNPSNTGVLCPTLIDEDNDIGDEKIVDYELNFNLSQLSATQVRMSYNLVFKERKNNNGNEGYHTIYEFQDYQDLTLPSGQTLDGIVSSQSVSITGSHEGTALKILSGNDLQEVGYVNEIRFRSNSPGNNDIVSTSCSDKVNLEITFGDIIVSVN